MADLSSSAGFPDYCEIASLEHASAEQQGDREIVLAAVKEDGLALEYASEELQGDRKIMLAAAGPPWRSRPA